MTKFRVSGRVENLNSMRGGLDSWKVGADTDGLKSQYRFTEKPNKPVRFFLHVISPKKCWLTDYKVPPP